MRIDGSITARSVDWSNPPLVNSRAGALLPLSSGESRKGFAPPFQHIPTDEFIVVHDEARGAVVIDLYLAAVRSDESPTYRLTGQGAVEVGRKLRKGGIIDLRA